MTDEHRAIVADPDTGTIQVSNVTVSRGDVTVLSDVSVSVAAGELVGLVGPNGAGKTTLLQTINGVLAPDAGRVTVDGTDVHGASARRVSRHVATVPQDTNVAFDFSVEDIVAMGRTPYQSRLGGTDHRADRRHVQRALDRTRTAEFADRPVGAVSGGERQRVLLARALAQDTPALLLDEPTASLDINHQVHTLDLVRDVVAEGKTALAAIHDLDLAARYCDRIVVLADGRIVASGPPTAVLDATTLDPAFDTEASVATHPVTGTPSVRALGGRPDRDLRVHVVGGGPRAARAIATLHQAGLTVTAGVLPAGDVAVETVRAHHLDAVVAPPFERISDDARDRALALVDRAEVTVVVGQDVASRPVLRALVSRAERRIVVESDDWSPDAASGRDAEFDRPGTAGRNDDRPDSDRVESAGRITTTVENVVGAVVRLAEAKEVPADD
jgi:iron complex transport system ATP-binding protein